MQEEDYDDEIIVVCSPPNQIIPTSPNEVTQGRTLISDLPCHTNISCKPILQAKKLKIYNLVLVEDQDNNEQHRLKYESEDLKRCSLQTNNIDNDANALTTTFEANPTIRINSINNGNEQEHSKCAETEKTNITINKPFVGTSPLLEGLEHNEPANHADFNLTDTDLENKQSESFVVTSGYIQECKYY